MFKAIFATATAALVAVSFGSSAYAGLISNGTRNNGLSLNGWQNGMSINGIRENGWSNGVSVNGMGLNGIRENGWTNGLSLNGTAPAATSFEIDGIELPAHVR